MLTFSEEAIIDNCNRLLAFLKAPSPFSIMDKISEYSPAGLIDLYSRILDINGAPVSGWSFLYLTGQDYKEMEYHCMTRCEDYKQHNAEKMFYFSALGYNWTVINK
jgi:hypothetical protein